MSEFNNQGIATYYVVPTGPGPHHKTELCDYYQRYEVNNEEHWSQILPHPPEVISLNSQSPTQQCASDFVRVALVTDEDMEGIRRFYPNAPGPDSNVSLFAGTAKTANISLGLPALLSASTEQDRQLLMVPVASGWTRGLILIFARKSDGLLIASTDPEIKNSPDC